MTPNYKVVFFDMKNFKTGEWEKFPDPLTDEKAKQFIPQAEPCQNLYELYRLRGDTPLDAMIGVLSLSCGYEPPKNQQAYGGQEDQTNAIPSE